MNSQKILFLGAPGVDKNQVMQRLSSWFRRQEEEHPRWKFIDFEKQYLWSARKISNFLTLPLRDQAGEWRAAWKHFVTGDLKQAEEKQESLFLGMHGAFSRRQYTLRSVVDPYLIARDFRPDLIVTLIDDIYDMKWRIDEKATGAQSKGQPSLEQLLYVRRQEVVVGDHIALACGDEVRNLMISTSHPAETLAHAVLNPRSYHAFYLSFAISQPRECEAKGNMGPRNEVSSFIREAYKRQTASTKSVVLCPLGVDEVPFISILPPTNSPLLCSHDVLNDEALLGDLRGDSKLATYLVPKLSNHSKELLFNSPNRNENAVVTSWLIHDLNRFLYEEISRGSLEEIASDLSVEAGQFMNEAGSPEGVLEANRLLLETAFPNAIDGLYRRKRDNPRGARKIGRNIAFDRAKLRWNLNEFWDAELRMHQEPRTDKTFKEIEMRNVRGNLMTDISWRDFRLVDQASELLVFNPVFENRDHVAGSVKEEVDHATTGRNPKATYIYQNPEYDKLRAVDHELRASLGEGDATMEEAALAEFRIRVRSLEELLDHLTLDR